MADKKQSLLVRIQKLLCVWEQSSGPRVILLLITSCFPMKVSACCCLQNTFWDCNAFFPKCKQTLCSLYGQLHPFTFILSNWHLKYLVIYFLCHISKQVYRLRDYTCEILEILKIICQVSTENNLKWIRHKNYENWDLLKHRKRLSAVMVCSKEHYRD